MYISTLILSLLIAEIKPDYLFLVFPDMKYRYALNYTIPSINFIVYNLEDATKVKQYFEKRKFRGEIKPQDSLEKNISPYIVRISLPEYMPVDLLVK